MFYCNCIILLSRKQILSQERDIQRKLNRPPATLSPIVISSQESVSTDPSPTQVNPSSLSTLPSTDNSVSKQSGLMSASSYGYSQSISNKALMSVDEGCDSNMYPLEEEEEETPQDDYFMEEDFETYSIPENFDDFLENPQPPLVASSTPGLHHSSSIGLPKSALAEKPMSATKAVTIASEPAHVGIRESLPSTSSGGVSTAKPVSSKGGSASKDDSPEFRGQYKHTKEMFKVFTQVPL